MASQLQQAQVGSSSMQVMLLDENMKPRTTNDGASNLSEFVTQLVLEESIDFPCIRATMVFQDSADLIDTLLGNEFWSLQLQTPQEDESYVYTLQCHAITDRIKRDKTNIYTIHLVSPEFLLNEVKNVFGSFKEKTFSDHVDTIIKSQEEGLGSSKKKRFIEKTKSQPKFVIPNWRPFDAIAWMAKHSIRDAAGSGDKPQGAFIFFENQKGFHFKSLDQLCKDAREQDDCFHYYYGPKKLGDESAQDYFAISQLSFPKTYDTLSNLRNGTWAGYSMELNLSQFTNSKMTTGSKDIEFKSVYYDITSYYKRMENLKKNGDIPVDIDFNQTTQMFTQTPKRVKYGLSPANLYTGMGDEVSYKKNDNTNNNDMNDPELRAYNYMRRYVLEQIQLQIDVPGNLELRAGEGIEIDIPSTMTDNKRQALDKLYSGRYIVAGVRHTFNLTNCVTTCMLYKDYVDKS